MSEAKAKGIVINMIKILCNPLTKLFLFLGSFVSAIFILRSVNLIFDRAVEFAFNRNNIVRSPLYEGVFYGRNLIFYAVIFSLCIGLLLFSIWKTKPQSTTSEIFTMWRKYDFPMMIIFATLIALLTFYGLRVIYAQAQAVFDVQPHELIGLTLLAYTSVALVLAELVARIRDKRLLSTLYWIRFVRIYPVWKPLGLLISLLLIGSLIVLVATAQEIVSQLTQNGWTTWTQFESIEPGFADGFAPTVESVERVREHNVMVTHRVQTVPPVVPVEMLFPFSLLTLIATTYFVTFALTLSNKYDEASAEKVRAEQFKSELITNVSHDIRTPLTSVINYVDLLKRLPLKGEASDYVSVLDRKADRLKVLIEDLMYASKAGSGNENVSMEPVNLNEILGQIAGEFEGTFIERDLTLVLTEPDDAIIINADSRHLWRVLENLFSNISKYALSGTRVFTDIKPKDESNAILTLKNTSEEPLESSKDSLTEQFIRGDKARQSEGSGLGLYIAKNLVELMEGQFEVQVIGDLFIVEMTLCIMSSDDITEEVE